MLGVLDCGLDMVPSAFLEVVGTEGSLFLADPWHSRSPRIEIRRPGGKEIVEVPPGDPYAAELHDFAAAVRGRAPPSVRARGRRRAGARDRRAVRRRGGLNRLPSVRMDGRLRPLGIGEMLDAAIKIFTRNWRTLVLCVVGLVLPVQILAVLVTASIAPESLDLTSSETGVVAR